MEKYGTVIINENEITKSEFDELNKVKNFDIFDPRQVASAIAGIHSLVKKGETQELSDDEQDLIKSGTFELNSMTKYTINEMKAGRIVKKDVFVLPKQVIWEETLEKSESGENIKIGIYLDTELNRSLDRVGDRIVKGKRMKKDDMMSGMDTYKAMYGMMKEKGMSEDMMKKAESMYSNGMMSNKMMKGMISMMRNGSMAKDIMMKGMDEEMNKAGYMSEDEMKAMKDSEMYKAMMGMVKKGEGSDKKAMMMAMKKKYPKADDKMMKKYMTHMYKSVSKAYMEKANDYANMSEDDDDMEKGGKYYKKEPDGKGGWKYYYKSGEVEHINKDGSVNNESKIKTLNHFIQNKNRRIDSLEYSDRENALYGGKEGKEKHIEKLKKEVSEAKAELKKLKK